MIMAPEHQKALAQFFEWAMKEVWHGYNDLDAGEVWDKAQQLNLLVKTTYDPEVHGECEFDAVPGDDWYVLPPWVEEAAK
jgi:hypothetical protein